MNVQLVERTGNEESQTRSAATGRPSAEHLHVNFPALAQLRLRAADVFALASQGFVSLEKRGNRRYWKLRFRRDGRQVVRSIGSAEQAHAVRAELAELQTDARQQRELKVLARRAR